MMRTILWTIWGLVPVAVLAFHFGPGQHLAARDLAARLQVDAIEAERAAMTAQDDAYAAHLATNALRRQALLGSDAALGARLEAAIATEERLYAVAAAAWEEAADAYEHVESALTDRPGPERDRVRLARARALVRSGDIWGGADELEVLLMELDDADEGSSELARATREELAGAHYFGARLLRLAGEPVAKWRPEAARARQHYRYLAESAAARGDAPPLVRGFEDNVERVLDLEQQDRSEVEGRALPRESPRVASGGPRPGNGPPRRTTRPPNRRDGRGAGGAEEIREGW